MLTKVKKQKSRFSVLITVIGYGLLIGVPSGVVFWSKTAQTQMMQEDEARQKSEDAIREGIHKASPKPQVVEARKPQVKVAEAKGPTQAELNKRLENESGPDDELKPPKQSDLIVDLFSLIGKEKQDMRRILGKYKVTDRMHVTDLQGFGPEMYGGDYTTYSIGQDMVVDVGVNAHGIVEEIRAEELQPLHYSLERSPELLSRFGADNIGEPFKRAPAAWYWQDRQTDQTRYVRCVGTGNYNGNGNTVWQVLISLNDR